MGLLRSTFRSLSLLLEAHLESRQLLMDMGLFFFSSNCCWCYGNDGGGCGFWWFVGDDSGDRSGVNRSSSSFCSIASGSGFAAAGDGLGFGGRGMRCSKWWLEVVFVKEIWSRAIGSGHRSKRFVHLPLDQVKVTYNKTHVKVYTLRVTDSRDLVTNPIDLFKAVESDRRLHMKCTGHRSHIQKIWSQDTDQRDLFTYHWIKSSDGLRTINLPLKKPSARWRLDGCRRRVDASEWDGGG
ncbi:Hypothetical predicted protein [Olea europaea subsp. europaea]|uniref:Uncharacterized protein n=1 Tax=Olea europaea subsp. europaea TaxID=158383 RepID=A0A8S0PX64_OLEEU|nr:Hypothetical predicted protein [Olea europaea subsp. europaea]